MRDWLPFAATDAEITAYAMNKALRPASVPETVRELYLEHALLRAALRTLVRDAAVGCKAWRFGRAHIGR